MKQPLITSIFGVFLSLVVGCQDRNILISQKNINNALTSDEMARLVLLDTNYQLSKSTARAMALDIAGKSLSSTDDADRSILNVMEIQSLYTLTGKTSIKTEFSTSKPNTPSLYVANFQNNLGYVIMSADKRVPKILAIVANGNIDSSVHVGLRIFLKNSIEYIDANVSKMEAMRADEVFMSMQSKLNHLNSRNSKSNITGKILCQAFYETEPFSSLTVTAYVTQPLLKTLWNQGPPYNNGQPDAGCFNSTYGCGSNTRWPAGCGPIAEGQVAAYFSAKNSPDWNAITNSQCASYTPDQNVMVSDLCHNIFLDYGIYVHRKDCSTGTGFQVGDIQFTNPRGISPKYGLMQGSWRSWNVGDIRNSLTAKSPVIISGWTHLICIIFCFGNSDAHEWVIDGMRDLNVQITYQTTVTYSPLGCSPVETYYFTQTTTSATQIHQNWGWGLYMGSGPNDWYAQDVFQESPTQLNFNHANYIVPYITSL